MVQVSFLDVYGIHWDTHVFAKIMKNHEKSMFIKSIQDALGNIQELPELLWNHPRCTSIDIIDVVRSTLLQVTRGRQTVQRGVLHLTVRRFLCHTITFPELHQSKNSRFRSSSFSMLFPMVKVPCPRTGSIETPAHFSKIIEKSWKLMFTKSIQDASRSI